MTYVLIYGAVSASFCGSPCRLIRVSGMATRTPVWLGGAA